MTTALAILLEVVVQVVWWTVTILGALVVLALTFALSCLRWLHEPESESPYHLEN